MENCIWDMYLSVTAQKIRIMQKQYFIFSKMNKLMFGWHLMIFPQVPNMLLSLKTQ